ncbi:hypothetical protein M9H77_12860 [Catharanthus roseus]|uniref:Uncharacterized protein n=1 Tax=Catharanthus roseus TaxID=4058 RepID=A0ACC0BIJ9_CATRO|nr:hypothetical protein M9H77_12860 [Catharanthus roseus]
MLSDPTAALFVSPRGKGYINMSNVDLDTSSKISELTGQMEILAIGRGLALEYLSINKSVRDMVDIFVAFKKSVASLCFCHGQLIFVVAHSIRGFTYNSPPARLLRDCRTPCYDITTRKRPIIDGKLRPRPSSFIAASRLSLFLLSSLISSSYEGPRHQRKSLTKVEAVARAWTTLTPKLDDTHVGVGQKPIKTNLTRSLSRMVAPSHGQKNEVKRGQEIRLQKWVVKRKQPWEASWRNVEVCLAQKKNEPQLWVVVKKRI